MKPTVGLKVTWERLVPVAGCKRKPMQNALHVTSISEGTVHFTVTTTLLGKSYTSQYEVWHEYFLDALDTFDGFMLERAEVCDGC